MIAQAQAQTQQAKSFSNLTGLADSGTASHLRVPSDGGPDSISDGVAKPHLLYSKQDGIKDLKVSLIPFSKTPKDHEKVGGSLRFLTRGTEAKARDGVYKWEIEAFSRHRNIARLREKTDLVSPVIKEGGGEYKLSAKFTDLPNRVEEDRLTIDTKIV